MTNEDGIENVCETIEKSNKIIMKKKKILSFSFFDFVFVSFCTPSICTIVDNAPAAKCRSVETNEIKLHKYFL